ncbi:hypothetical protein [Fusibacter sp. 3D3]|uniref:hypothetical protein n=1 Tax=Fusibacter sp. 3D3 TaxID=1048380 RepID=UPI00085326CF|nr:hypothetical protein [Fusibacter sp. 3D3]GAU75571.1 hypothetical protein F3D3_0162 [Fusibacter sp. 3D3]
MAGLFAKFIILPAIAIFPLFITFLKPLFFKEQLKSRNVIMTFLLFIQVKPILTDIVSSLETVYGIVLAFLILGEIPTIREIVGGLLL